MGRALVYGRQPLRGFGGGGRIGGLTGPVPKDVWWLLGAVFVTFSLQYFAATAALPALLRLTPAVWRSAFIWQLVTYPFAGAGAPGLLFLLELLILFLFARDVFTRLGRRRFWWLLVSSSAVAAAVAVLVALAILGLGGGLGATPAFTLMQGQRMLLTVLIAAFATLHRDATIYLFFVLPIQARWFLLLEIVFAFMGFLATRDLAGFLGICTGVAFTFASLDRRSGAELVRRAWLRLRHLWFRLRLAWHKRRRGLRVVREEPRDREGPWLH